MSSIALALALSSISLVGIILNVVVLKRMSSNKRLQTIANIFFFNQAIADVLFLSVLPLVGSEYYLGQWIFGDFSCRLLIIMDTMNQFTSILLLVFMSSDRYFCIVHPMKSVRIRSRKYAWMSSVSAWFLAAGICCPLWFHKSTNSGSETRMCYFTESESEEADEVYKYFTLWAFTLGFIVPLSIISTCNILIIRSVRSENRLLTVNRPLRQQQREEQKRKKTLAIVITCVIIFIICWLPLYIFLIYMYFFHAEIPQNSAQTHSSPPTSGNQTQSTTTSVEADTEAADESSILGHVRMGCLLMSYCNGMLNPMVLLIMTSYSPNKSSNTEQELLRKRSNVSQANVSTILLRKPSSNPTGSSSNHKLPVTSKFSNK